MYTNLKDYESPYFCKKEDAVYKYNKFISTFNKIKKQHTV